MEALILITCINTSNGQQEVGHVLISENQQEQVIEQADQLCTEDNPLYVPERKVKKIKGHEATKNGQ